MNTKDVLQGLINIAQPDFVEKNKSWKNDVELVALLKENESSFNVEEYICDLQFMMGHQGIDVFSEMKYILRQEIQMKRWIKEYGPFVFPSVIKTD